MPRPGHSGGLIPFTTSGDPVCPKNTPRFLLLNSFPVARSLSPSGLERSPLGAGPSVRGVVSTFNLPLPGMKAQNPAFMTKVMQISV